MCLGFRHCLPCNTKFDSSLYLPCPGATSQLLAKNENETRLCGMRFTLTLEPSPLSWGGGRYIVITTHDEPQKLVAPCVSMPCLVLTFTFARNSFWYKKAWWTGTAPLPVCPCRVVPRQRYRLRFVSSSSREEVYTPNPLPPLVFHPHCFSTRSADVD